MYGEGQAAGVVEVLRRTAEVLMKKKCTNSACRRTFTVGKQRGGRCPHCDKVYPRLPADAKRFRGPYVLRVKSYNKDRSGFVWCTLRRFAGYREHDLDCLPLFIDYTGTKEQAARMMGTLVKLGCSVDLIPRRQVRNI